MSAAPGPPAPDPDVRPGAILGTCGYCGAPAWVNPSAAVASLNDVPEYVYAPPVSGAPPAGLTVETLASVMHFLQQARQALEEGYGWDNKGEEGGARTVSLERHAYQRARRALESATDLCNKPVSPGAPPAARRDPTDAMIDAASQAIGALLEAEGFVIHDGTYPPQLAEAALRAALAASTEHP